MKICHISTGFPISYQGGVTNYVRSLAEFQISQGHDVYVISGPDDKQFNFNTEIYKSDEIVPMKLSKPVDKTGLRRIQRFLDDNKFDLIHVHMMLDVDWDIYDVIKQYKYIVSLHDYFFICPRIQMLMPDNTVCKHYDASKCSRCVSWFNTHRILNGLENKIAKKTPFHNFRFPEIPSDMTIIRYEKFKKFLEGASFLMPVSSRVQEIFEQSGINGRYRMIHIGNITADNYVEEYSFDEDKYIIDVAMMGTLTYLKGADLFVRLANEIDKDKVKFHFYGRAATYSDAIRDAGIIDHGPYRQADLPKILNCIDIGLCLSVWEDNGPQVVMELLNNHIPVVGTRLGGIPDFVEDGVNGYLFNPFDENDIQRIIDILNNMSRKQLKYLVERIHRTKTTEEHCREMALLYKEAIDS